MSRIADARARAGQIARTEEEVMRWEDERQAAADLLAGAPRRPFGPLKRHSVAAATDSRPRRFSSIADAVPATDAESPMPAEEPAPSRLVRLLRFLRQRG